MYYLLEHKLNSIVILGVCNCATMKLNILANELLKSNIKLMNTIDEIKENGMYCIPSKTTMNKYDIICAVRQLDGYFYSGELEKRVVGNYEFVYYKLSDGDMLRSLLNQEMLRFIENMNYKANLKENLINRMKTVYPVKINLV